MRRTTLLLFLLALVTFAQTPVEAGFEVAVPAKAPPEVHQIAKNLCAAPQPAQNLEATSCPDCGTGAPKPPASVAALSELNSALSAQAATAERDRRDLAALRFIDKQGLLSISTDAELNSIEDIDQRLRGRRARLEELEQRLAMAQNRVKQAEESHLAATRLERGSITPGDYQILKPELDKILERSVEDVERAEESLARYRDDDPPNPKKKKKSANDSSFDVGIAWRQDEVIARKKDLKNVKKWLAALEKGQVEESPLNLAKDLVGRTERVKTDFQYMVEDRRELIQEVKQEINRLNNRRAELEKALAGGPAPTELQRMENKYRSAVGNFLHCGLTIGEAAALHSYTAQGYRILNEALRQGGIRAEEVRDYKAAVEAALRKIRPYDGTVKRGVELPSYRLAQHEVGNIVTYPGFTSTSVGDDFEKKQHYFYIKSKTGRYVGFHSAYGDEWEVLFAPGTKFKVLSREDAGYGRLRFTMEEVD